MHTYIIYVLSKYKMICILSVTSLPPPSSLMKVFPYISHIYFHSTCVLLWPCLDASPFNFLVSVVTLALKVVSKELSLRTVNNRKDETPVFLGLDY